MTTQAKTHSTRLSSEMSADEFDRHYWMKAELVDFARHLGLRSDGYKPQLTKRIRAHLEGKTLNEPPPVKPQGVRDSAQTLTRKTPVVNYKSDAATRAFFKREIGDHFHFSYDLNQYRLHHKGPLTYGDLVDEWQRQQAARDKPGAKPKIPRHAQWNRFVRAYFADSANKGRTMKDAAKAWQMVKPTSDQSYAHYQKMQGRGAVKE